MAKKIDFGVGGKARNVKNAHFGVNGKARKIKNAYLGVDGKARLFWSSNEAVEVGELAVGNKLKLNVNNVTTNFLVVHQGNPNSAIYDTSCNGTWLVSEDINSLQEWNKQLANDYANSDIFSWLNGTYINLFDSKALDAIKLVRIPYRPGSGTSRTSSYGSDGLYSLAFLLSAAEVGYNSSYQPLNEGDQLAYFTSDASRIAEYNGTPRFWWLRSPDCTGAEKSCAVLSDGAQGTLYIDVSYSGPRPAVILISTTPCALNDDGTYSLI